MCIVENILSAFLILGNTLLLLVGTEREDTRDERFRRGATRRKSADNEATCHAGA
jgi:hypothetical protein